MYHPDDPVSSSESDNVIIALLSANPSLGRFLQYPSSPPLRKSLEIKACGQVLTSIENLKLLEENRKPKKKSRKPKKKRRRERNQRKVKL